MMRLTPRLCTAGVRAVVWMVGGRGGTRAENLLTCTRSAERKRRQAGLGCRLRNARVPIRARLPVRAIVAHELAYLVDASRRDAFPIPQPPDNMWVAACLNAERRRCHAVRIEKLLDLGQKGLTDAHGPHSIEINLSRQ